MFQVVVTILEAEGLDKNEIRIDGYFLGCKTRIEYSTVMKICPIAVLLLLIPTESGCSSTPDAKSVPRETARAAVIMLAKTTALADETCSTLARTKQDAALAKKCADAYDVIRPSLLAAENGVNAWEAGSKNQVACAIAKSAAALVDMNDAIKASGENMSMSVSDSLKFVTPIVGECHPASGGTSAL